MHINYQYLLSKAMIRTDGYTPVVLDYGCGSGGIMGRVGRQD